MDCLDNMVFFICFCTLLVLSAISDLRTRQIPTIYNFLLAACFWINPFWNKTDSFIGFLVCGGILLLCCLIQENAFGGGDIKLCAAAGFTLGLPALLGLCISTLVSLPASYFASKKKKGIPFAPYLAVGFSLTAFFHVIQSNGGML